MASKIIEEIYENLIKIREERARMEEQQKIIKLIQGLDLSQETKYYIQLSIYNQ